MERRCENNQRKVSSAGRARAQTAEDASLSANAAILESLRAEGELHAVVGLALAKDGEPPFMEETGTPKLAIFFKYDVFIKYQDSMNTRVGDAQLCRNYIDR